MKISICIPIYNDAPTINELIKDIQVNLFDYELEVILVNDGSQDNTAEICMGLARQHDFVKFINLRKNFGEHNAVLCGLNYSTGDYVAIIDADLQHPPSEIVKLLNVALSHDYDVVYSKYKEKKHHWFRNLGSAFNDKVATYLLSKPEDLYLSSFKLIKKELVEEIIKYRGPFPYIDGLVLRVTDSIGTVYVEHSERVDGESSYTLAKLISLWLNMFVNFSIKPLRIATVTGMAISFFSFLFGIYFIIEKILYPDTAIGWTSLMVAVLFLSGIQLVFLGIIGEYLGKQYLDQNGTPPYVVKQEYI